MSVLPESYPLPITPIGVLADDMELLFRFRRPSGEVIALTFSELFLHDNIRTLFGADETWLRLKFPVTRLTDNAVWLVIGFDAARAADYLAARALRAEYFPPDYNADTAALALADLPRELAPLRAGEQP